MSSDARSTESRAKDNGAARRRAEPGSRLSPEDRALIRAILEDGDEEAFVTLVNRYHASLLRQAAAMLSDHAAAEDVLQETWVAVLEGLKRFEGRAALRTWITRILINRIKTRRYKEWRYVGLTEPGGEGTSAVDPDAFDRKGHWRVPVERWADLTPQRLAESSEILKLIERALEDLPPNQRAVVVLRDVEGYSSQEACEALELSEMNQRVLLHRGRSRLRRALAAYRATGERG